jgi:hypothetical protein
MQKLILGVAGALVLATATATSAYAGHGGHGGAVAKLKGSASGLATSSGSATGDITAGKPLSDGTFTISISTDWSKAKSGKHGSCAPSTGTLSLAGTDTSNSITATLRGVTCTVTDSSHNIDAVFAAHATVTGSTGTATKVTGHGRVFLAEKTDGTAAGKASFGHGHRRHGHRHYAHRHHAQSGDPHHCHH